MQKFFFLLGETLYVGDEALNACRPRSPVGSNTSAQQVVGFPAAAWSFGCTTASWRGNLSDARAVRAAGDFKQVGFQGKEMLKSLSASGGKNS